MDYFTAFSWPYSKNSEFLARQFFDKLRAGIEGGKKFPFEKPHQIALVRNRSGDLFVGVLVLPGTTRDDSYEIYNVLKAWFEECEAGNYEDYESIPVKGGTIQTTLGVGYVILENIRDITGPGGTKPPTPAAAVVKEQRANQKPETAKSEPSAVVKERPTTRQTEKAASKKKWWEFWK